MPLGWFFLPHEALLHGCSQCEYKSSSRAFTTATDHGNVHIPVSTLTLKRLVRCRSARNSRSRFRKFWLFHNFLAIGQMHLFMLPTEVKLQIYEELLACPSTVVKYVPRKIRTTKSRFQPKTASSLSPQLLRVCRQIRREALPILYGNHRFNCAFSARSVGKLRVQIGFKNLRASNI
jgi:hypothetical protein